MALSKPLSFGKHHHCSIYYNYYEGHRSRCDEDQRRSYDFVKHLDDRLCEIGFTEVHYFDKIPPGVNLFDELFSNMLELSEKIVVIFTDDFITNHWHKMVHQSNFKELLYRKESENFLGISLGLTKSQLSNGLGMCVHSLVYFDTNWKDDEEQWNSITRFFLGDCTTHANLERSISNVPVQATTSDIDTDGLDDSNRGNGDGDVGSRNSNVIHKEDTNMNVSWIKVGGAADLNDSHSTVVHGIDDSPGAAAEVVNNSPGAAAVVSDHDIRMRANLSETSSDKSLQDENNLCQDACSISIKSRLNREEGSIRGFAFRAWNIIGWLKKNVSL